MKNRGFTDKLYLVNLISTWLFVVTGIVCTILESNLGIIDLTVFNVGIPCVFAELSVHTGFIIWKAKQENISKYGYKDTDEE